MSNYTPTPGRAMIPVYYDAGEYVAEWDGTKVRAGNPFGLDSKLSSLGAPAPRDLVFQEDDA